MKNELKVILRISIFLLFVSCSEQTAKVELSDQDGWHKESQIVKVIKNVNYNFPGSGYAYDNKEVLIDKCFESMRQNIQIIGLNDFKDTIQIRFLNSRDDMFWLTRTSASGIAYPHINTLYVVADGENNPPIKHELMHLIAMLNWGQANYSSTWINEGLATYAEDNCNGYNVAQIYRYFLGKNMLISVDSMATDFYAQPEMVAYHQSAFIVEYLLTNYTLDQFRELWTKGFDSFQNIYGISFSEMKKQLEKSVLKKYPTIPDIKWDVFKEGCK